MKNCWSLLNVVILVMLLAMARAGPSASQCKKERRLAVNACKSMLYGRLPSLSCCQRMRVTHIKCICSILTPKMVALVNANTIIKLIEGCGRKVPHHFKCGSISLHQLSHLFRYTYSFIFCWNCTSVSLSYNVNICNDV